MFSKKDNGKLKVNWDAIGILIIIVVMAATGIDKSSKLQGQTELTAKTVSVIVKNTTEKVEGTLKSDVEKNKEVNAVQGEEISVLKSSMAEVKKTQDETRRAISDLNKKIDDNQRDLMNAIINLGKK